MSLIQKLESYDQNILCKALDLKQFEQEPVRVVFKLNGIQFPPQILYTVKLLNSTSVNRQFVNSQTEQSIPAYIQSQHTIRKTKQTHYIQLTHPKNDGKMVSCRLLNENERTSFKKLLFKAKKQQSELQKRAQQLRILFGLEQPEPEFDESLIASQVNDLKQFIQMINSRERTAKISNEVEKQFDIDNRIDLDQLMDNLPETRF